MSGRGKGGKGLGKGGAKRHRKVLRDNIQGEHAHLAFPMSGVCHDSLVFTLLYASLGAIQDFGVCCLCTDATR